MVWAFLLLILVVYFLTMRPATDMLDVSVQYNEPGDHWSVTVGGTNLLDDRYLVTGQAQFAGAKSFGSSMRCMAGRYLQSLQAAGRARKIGPKNSSCR